MSALPRDVFFKAAPGREGAVLESSHLEKGLTARGVLDTNGELRVSGNFIGRINAGRLILDADGYVEGDIVAREVRVEGRLRGRIFALNVTVESTADVKGRIFHNTINVAKGARIEGPMPWRPPSYFDQLEQLPEARS
jgi:cytoskeletal protein CcmA (bactofilin family)